MGLENILKRFCRNRGVELPEGPHWHKDLIDRFVVPGVPGLPTLLDSDLAGDIDNYRRFRHFFVHGYSVLLDWEKVRPGVEKLAGVKHRIFHAVRTALLESADPP